MNVKKVYSYVICLVALIILMWGVVDVISASLGYIAFKPQPSSYDMAPPDGAPFPGGEMKGIEPSIEDYYQKRMVLDRIGDSLARIIVSGLVFGYFSLKIKGLEEKGA
jgi:hypothetical protein